MVRLANGRWGGLGSEFGEVAAGDGVVVEDGGFDGDAFAAEGGEGFGPGAEEFDGELAGGGV